jgi:hypothetical protein
VAGNHFKHALEVAEDLVVPEAEDLVALLGEEGRALRIGIALDRMLATIELDGQVMLGAAEVDDVWPDQMLPAKLDADESAVTKPGPEATLSIRL